MTWPRPDRPSPVSLSTGEPIPAFPGIDPAFLARCLETRAASQRTKVPSIDAEVAAKNALYTENYPQAFTDTHGTPSQGPLLYKTGAAWPEPPLGPEGQPYLREYRPAAHTHPIAKVWGEIREAIAAYLDELDIKVTVITGLGFANSQPNANPKTKTRIGVKLKKSKREAAFCPLVILIGVLPETIEFTTAKVAAEHVKDAILAPAGFGDLDVAVREWATRQSGGARLPLLDPVINGDIAALMHPFSTTLGIAVAPAKKPSAEGTLGLFLKRGQASEDIVAITCCHVACPDNARNGLTVKAADRHHQEIIALSTRYFTDSVNALKSEIGNLTVAKASLDKKANTLQTRVTVTPGETKVEEVLQHVRQDAAWTAQIILWLNERHGEVTKNLTFPEDRLLGRVMFAMPIGPSSTSNRPDDRPDDAHTIDIAGVLVRKDAFADNSELNCVYIGPYVSAPVSSLVVPSSVSLIVRRRTHRRRRVRVPVPPAHVAKRRRHEGLRVPRLRPPPHFRVRPQGRDALAQAAQREG